MIAFPVEVNTNKNACDDDNDEEWEEQEHQDELFLELFSNHFFTDAYRKPKWIHDRIVWEIYVQGLHHAGKFKQNYQMSERVFKILLSMIYPKLHKNKVLSSNSTSGLGEVISPEMTMAIVICLLAAAS